VAEAVVVGAHRTPVQDLDFAIRHLVEIAVRALSPGINDPYTAVSVISQLSAAMARLLGSEMPAGVFRDSGGRTRVLCPRPTHATTISSAFDQIRQSGGDKPLVVLNLIAAVERLAPHVRTPGQAELLRGQLDTILETARRAVPDASDRADIEARAEAARAALANRRLRHG
jgi:uncharacterized membrane protein